MPLILGWEAAVREPIRAQRTEKHALNTWSSFVDGTAGSGFERMRRSRLSTASFRLGEEKEISRSAGNAEGFRKRM